MARKATGQIVTKQTQRGTSYALRFRAYGQRRYLTLGLEGEACALCGAGVTYEHVEEELANVLADVRRGVWKPDDRPAVEEPKREPTFHEFASEWYDARCQEGLVEKTLDGIHWQLTYILLPHFKDHRLSEITVQEVDRYRQAQVRERERLAEVRNALDAEETRELDRLASLADAGQRDAASEVRRAIKTIRARRRELRRPLANGTINRTISLLGQILEQAVEYGLIESNPAAGKRRKLKARRPRRSYLDSALQIEALLSAAHELDEGSRADRRHIARRTILATLVFAGLRISELLALRWGDVDLAGGWLRVKEESDGKTEAATRKVKIRPVLRDELLAYKARVAGGANSYVFGTSAGNPQSASNIRNRVLARAVEIANERLAEQDEAPLPALTPHGLRRSFASLLYAIGEPPTVVMAEMGHTDPALALAVYAQSMRRDEAENERLRALVNGHQWALSGLGEAAGSAAESPVPPPEGAQSRL